MRSSSSAPERRRGRLIDRARASLAHSTLLGVGAERRRVHARRSLLLPVRRLQPAPLRRIATSAKGGPSAGPNAVRNPSAPCAWSSSAAATGSRTCFGARGPRAPRAARSRSRRSSRPRTMAAARAASATSAAAFRPAIFATACSRSRTTPTDRSGACSPHRYAGAGDLAGHSLGNLLLMALAEQEGSLPQGRRGRRPAARASADGCCPRALGALRLEGETIAGERISGESRIGAAPAAIRRVWLEPRGGRAGRRRAPGAERRRSRGPRAGEPVHQHPAGAARARRRRKPSAPRAGRRSSSAT